MTAVLVQFRVAVRALFEHPLVGLHALVGHRDLAGLPAAEQAPARGEAGVPQRGDELAAVDHGRIRVHGDYHLGQVLWTLERRADETEQGEGWQAEERRAAFDGHRPDLALPHRGRPQGLHVRAVLFDPCAYLISSADGAVMVWNFAASKRALGNGCNIGRNGAGRIQTRLNRGTIMYSGTGNYWEAQATAWGPRILIAILIAFLMIGCWALVSASQQWNSRREAHAVAASAARAEFLFWSDGGGVHRVNAADGSVAKASPKDATSTPRSLSFVDMSAPRKLPSPPSSRSTTTSAIA